MAGVPAEKLRELAIPFPKNRVQWRVEKKGIGRNGRVYAMVLVYLDNRSVMDRLDEVCGPENWQNEFVRIEGGMQAGIGILVEGSGWIWKHDGTGIAEAQHDGRGGTENQMKGAFSGAQKRAAVNWSVGKYLYDLPSCFAEVSETECRDPGWHKDSVKDQAGNYRDFWWQEPSLPGWALPEGDTSQDRETRPQPQNQPQQDRQQSSPPQSRPAPQGDKPAFVNYLCPHCNQEKVGKSRYPDRATGKIGGFCFACKAQFTPEEFAALQGGGQQQQSSQTPPAEYHSVVATVPQTAIPVEQTGGQRGGPVPFFRVEDRI